MVQSIQCYLDGAGGIHRTAADAHRADLQHWLQATGAVNEASAAALSRLVVDNRDTLSELMSMLKAVTHDTTAETVCE